MSSNVLVQLEVKEHLPWEYLSSYGGKRTKENHSGIAAIDCPGCANRVVADIFDFYSASHVYFIRGSYQKEYSFARCRFCGLGSELPPDINISSSFSTDTITPTNNFIEETNPSLLNSPCTIPPLVNKLPEGVNRDQWALCWAILQNIENQSKSSKAAGNPEGLFILIGVIGLFLSMIIYDRYAQAPVLPLTTLCFSIIFLFYSIYKLQNKIIFRAVHKTMGVYVQRISKFNKENLKYLIMSSKLLGRSFKKARQYLIYAQRNS